MRTLAGALRDQAGQDLIEYALIASLVALGSTAVMGTLANGIGTAYGNVAATLASYTSGSGNSGNAGSSGSNGNSGNNGNHGNGNNGNHGTGNNGNGKG